MSIYIPIPFAGRIRDLKHCLPKGTELNYVFVHQRGYKHWIRVFSVSDKNQILDYSYPLAAIIGDKYDDERQAIVIDSTKLCVLPQFYLTRNAGVIIHGTAEAFGFRVL